jgi:hypothetical protein
VSEDNGQNRPSTEIVNREYEKYHAEGERVWNSLIEMISGLYGALAAMLRNELSVRATISEVTNARTISSSKTGFTTTKMSVNKVIPRPDAEMNGGAGSRPISKLWIRTIAKYNS